MNAAASNPGGAAGYGLAIETSGRWGGVALGVDGEVLEVRRFTTLERHASELLPCMADMCGARGVEPRQITWVTVSIGPGSFTGLRIGLTVARTLALAWGAQLSGVPSLEVVAQNALTALPVPDRVVVLVDAKRNHVYAAEFVLRDGSYVSVSDPVEVDPSQFLLEKAGCALLGEGVALHRPSIDAAGVVVLPDSLNAADPAVLYRLGFTKALRGEDFLKDPKTLVPLYVRPPEPEEKRATRASTQD